MSGRIRTIKPEWLEDEELHRAGVYARVLSIALVLLADDYGRGRCITEVLAYQVFGLEPEPLEKFREAFAKLSDMGFVGGYEVRGQSYFAISNWQKHQRVDKPGKPRVPAPLAVPENPREVPANVFRNPGPDHDHDLEGELEASRVVATRGQQQLPRIPEVNVGDVHREWHAAATPGVLHGQQSWRGDFGDIADAINRHPKIRPENRQRMLTKLCLWVWQDPEGPRGSGRLVKITPDKVAKRVTEDIDAAAQSHWIDSRLPREAAE